MTAYLTEVNGNEQKKKKRKEQKSCGYTSGLTHQCHDVIS